jgi:hypothetical protein
MRILILWVGIAAFVLIGLFPPMARWDRRHIDIIRLLCDWAVVAVLTGGVFWSETRVGSRLYPWLRARRRIVLGVNYVNVVLLLCLIAEILLWRWGLIW